MQPFNLVTLLSLQMSLTSALTIPNGNVKRSIVSDVVLYAYGQGAADWPISYGLNDSERIPHAATFLRHAKTLSLGKLYVTASPENTSANLAPVKWSL